MKTKLEELRDALEAATPGEWWEDDDGFVAAGHGDSYRTVADARCNVAPFSDANTEFITLAHNNMAALLEAVERLEAMQRVIGELASMNPFLASEFAKNKDVLEKLE